MERYSRSFIDALTLARNSRDQATIYYCQGNTRAVYDVVSEMSAKFKNVGSMIVNGRHLTGKDIPPSLRSDIQCESAHVLACTRDAAKQVWEHNGIDTSTGWDLRP